MPTFDHPEELIVAGLSYLVHHPEPITYSDFNAKLGNPFILDLDYDRARFGDLLGVITRRLRDDSPNTRHFMLSALVHTKEGGPGPGFYDFAVELGLLKRNADDFKRMEFWVNQVDAIRDYYGDTR